MVLSLINNYYLSCCALCVPEELNGVGASVNKADDVSNQPARLEQARTLGRNIIKYANRV